MGLEWISLSDRNEESFFDLFELGQWKIKKAIIISAYTDVEALTVLVDGIIDQKNEQEGSVLQIFLDKTASRFKSNEKIKSGLKRLNSLITKKFSENSGIFLVSGKKLFHSKCYIFEGRDYGKFFMGSMNLTNAGIKKNEEVLCRGDYIVGTKEVNSIFSKNIVSYCNKILENEILNCKKVNLINIEKYEYNNFRDVILDGHIYTYYNENSPLYIRLDLPEGFKILETDIEFHDAERRNYISIEKIIQSKYSLEKGKNTSRSKWKKYCIETCYGYWAPSEYEIKISKELSKKNKKISYYEKVKKILKENNKEIENYFNETIEKIKNKVNEEGFDWEFNEKEKWDRWYDRIIEKLENEDFIRRLCSGVRKSPCVDVWEDKVVRDSFEKSFEDSFKYLVEKDITHNEIFNIIKKENPNVLVGGYVLKNIKKWIVKNRKNIFTSTE